MVSHMVWSGSVGAVWNNQSSSVRQSYKRMAMVFSLNSLTARAMLKININEIVVFVFPKSGSGSVL